jgi:hypothetical protein
VLVIIHIKDDKLANSMTEKEMHAGLLKSRKEKTTLENLAEIWVEYLGAV